MEALTLRRVQLVHAGWINGMLQHRLEMVLEKLHLVARTSVASPKAKTGQEIRPLRFGVSDARR
jgi:hypothetical protein